MSETMMHGVPPGEQQRYEEGLRYMQAGQWQAAIDRFSTLLNDYPDNRAFQAALADAYFKAELDTGLVKGKGFIFPWRKLAMGLLLMVIVVVTVAAIREVSAQLAPIQAQAELEREQARQAQLLVDANALLAAGELDRAEALFQELLAAAPEHEGALQGLAEVADRREIVALYEEGVALQDEARDYEGALAKFTVVSEAWPGYRDVNYRISQLEAEVGIDALFASAGASYESGDWLEAIAGYERVRALSSSYQQEQVAARLIELYITVGRDTVNARPTRYNQLTQARSYFTAALALDPRNRDALQEQRFGLLYAEGLRLSQEKKWSQAIPPLLTIYENERLDYMGGSALNLLYNAYVHLGDELREAEEMDAAYDFYLRAKALPRVDQRAVNQRLARMERLLGTPTPPATRTR